MSFGRIPRGALRNRATIFEPVETLNEQREPEVEWVPIAQDVPCSWQPMDDRIRRSFSGEEPVGEWFGVFDPEQPIAKGRRVDVDGRSYILRAAKDAAGLGHHWETGADELPVGSVEASP